MSQRVTVTVVDDLDGTEAAETIQFGLDGVMYEIDLSEKNTSQLRDAFAPWVGAARRVAGRKQRTRASTRRGDLNEIRAWANKNGYSVSDRGRVADEVLLAYDAAS